MSFGKSVHRKITITGFGLFVLFFILIPGAREAGAALSHSIEAAVVAIESVTLVDNDNYPIPFEQKVRLKAGVTPEADLALKWTLLPDPNYPGVRAELIDPTDTICYFRPSENSESGFITVKVELEEYPDINQEVSVQVGCSECIGEDSACMMPANEQVRLSSIDFLLSLGKAANNMSAGSLFIRSKQASLDLATPKALQFSSLAHGVQPVYDDDGTIRQIIAPQTFVDIVAENAYLYQIRFYDPSAMGALQDGVYQVENATPFAVWQVENPDASPSAYSKLKLTKIEGGSRTSHLYTWDEARKACSLSKYDGLQNETRSKAVNQNNDIVYTHIVKDSDGRVSSFVETTRREFAWGESTIKTVRDPDGLALTTLTSYYEDTDNPEIDGKIETQINPDGSWVKYQYDRYGRKAIEIRPWRDSDIHTAASAARAVYYDYHPVHTDDAGLKSNFFDPRVVTEKIQGQTVSKTYYLYTVNHHGEKIEIVEQAFSPGAQFGDADNLRTTRTYESGKPDERLSERLKTIAYPDGRLVGYTYAYGRYAPGSDTTKPGTFTVGEGEDLRTAITNGTVDHPDGIAGKTTRETEVRLADGSIILQETAVYDGTGFATIQWTVSRFDQWARKIAGFHSDGTRTDSAWGCCGKESETDRKGGCKTYSYDGLKRIESITLHDATPSGDIVQTFTYDGSGRRLTETITGGDISRTTVKNYHKSGRLAYTIDAAGLQTDYEYRQGGRIVVVTQPGDIVRTTENYLDGRVKRITGNGVVPRYYTYGYTQDGEQWTRVNTGSASSSLWEKTTRDMLGRTIRTEKPGFTGTVVTTNGYNHKGQLIRTTTTGQADTLYVYDETGSQIQSGLDVDGSGALETISPDRINETETRYITIDDGWWRQTTQKTYLDETSEDTTVIDVQRNRLSGFCNAKTSETVSTDIHGNQTISITTLNRDTMTETRFINYPDADLDAVSVTVNGLLTMFTNKAGVTTTYEYDALGRRIRTIDSRTGTALTHYNDKGQIDYIEDAAASRTGFSYDPTTGRKTSETNASGKVTRYAYNDRGKVIRTWGDTVYPVEYIYDDRGRMQAMHTYRSHSGWEGDSWPEGQTADTTTWHYQDATGLLVSKEDAQGYQVSYTYTPAGKLQTRTWARTADSQAIKTTYSYDANTGELLHIDYSDATPDIAFTYDRTGKQKTISDVVGTRTFAYNAGLQVETETITGMVNKVITRTYDTGNVPGRATGFHTGVDYAVTYGYDENTGRFNSVSWNVNDTTHNATYSYVPGSNMIRQMTTDTGQTIAYTYESNRDLKTRVMNSFNDTLISQYDYTYDALGRRATVQNSGTAFETAAFNRFGYNDRNELTDANRYQGTDINDLSTLVDPETRIYNYDPIGNRTDATEGSVSTVYIANNLNQYDSITEVTSINYDEDGNLIEKDGAYYRYDAENRLSSVEKLTPAVGDKIVEFVYDYQGRRIQKLVSTWDGSEYVESTEKLFLYDGWNLIQEVSISGATETSRYYSWGLDLSNSLQGAGGIGGLLAVVDNGNTYHVNYDANGNVGQLVTAADGDIAAHYEYDPFGKLNYSSGSYADENPFRFSTKYHDDETELVYYGYRYYSNNLGAWINRDPLEERGGLNLYTFVLNDSINIIDPYGLLSNTSEEAILAVLDNPNYSDEEKRKIVRNIPTDLPDPNIYNPYLQNNINLSDIRIDIGICGSTFIQRVAIPDAPFSFDFSGCCEKHDLCYQDCNKTKKICDDEFRNCMLNRVKAEDRWFKPDTLGKVSAHIYSWAVRTQKGCKAYIAAQRDKKCCPITCGDKGKSK